MDKAQLKDLVGRKLVWWTYDEEQERTYLFFEGMEGLAVDGVCRIADGKLLAQKILSEQLDEAVHVLSLKSLLGGDSSSDGSVCVETHGGTITLDQVSKDE